MPPLHRQWQTVISGCHGGEAMLARHGKPPAPVNPHTAPVPHRGKQAPTPPSTRSHNRSVSRYSHILTHLPTHMSTHTHTHTELDPGSFPQPGSQTQRYRPLTWSTQTSRGPEETSDTPSHPTHSASKEKHARQALPYLHPQEKVFGTPRE